MGVNSLPKTVTGQRCGCDLNPGPAAPESSTLTTRLPSHPSAVHKESNSFNAECSLEDRTRFSRTQPTGRCYSIVRACPSTSPKIAHSRVGCRPPSNIVQGGPKNRTVFRLDNFVTVSPRKACSMSKSLQRYRDKGTKLAFQ